MKNTTFSADEDLIEQARITARVQHRSLNVAFREWLLQFTAQAGNVQEYDRLMKRLKKHVNAGRKCTPEERNER